MTFKLGDVVRPNYSHSSSPGWSEGIVTEIREDDGPGQVHFCMTKVSEYRFYYVGFRGWDLPKDLALVQVSYDYIPSQEGDKEDDL